MNLQEYKLFFLLISSLLFFSCSNDIAEGGILDERLKDLVNASTPSGDYSYYIMPDENDLGNIPQDRAHNPLTPVKVELGKLLFHETALGIEPIKSSGFQTYSCSSCHIPETGFRAGNHQGIADGGSGFGKIGESRVKNQEYLDIEMDVQRARPLSLVNVAYVRNTFWNGRFGGFYANEGTNVNWVEGDGTFRNALGYEAIETQNFNGTESHRLNINEALADSLGYKTMFDQAFPEIPVEQRYNRATLSLALSAYIRTILSNQAPFQKWLKGDANAMTDAEKRGGILFFGKANCKDCHYEQNLGSIEFHALGVKDADQIGSYKGKEDLGRTLGRGAFTKKEDDNYKFKVPTAYNASDAQQYFHGASINSLEELIDYKILARSENPNVPNNILSKKFVRLNLTDAERLDLIAFVSKSLRDPNLKRYVPAYVLSGFCFPNNDTQAKIDQKCN